MNIGTESEPVEVPLPVHPDEAVPAELPAEPDAEPAREPVPAAEILFEGHEPRECGEHRTAGPHRAWCHGCTEWCYPDDDGACKGCRIPMLERRLQAGTPA